MRSLKVSFSINVFGALVPLVVALFTIPIYIKYIGDARYGILSIIWILLGYAGFLDLGLSRAAANTLSRIRTGSQEKRARVIVTTLVLNLGTGLIGSVILAIGGRYLIKHVLSIPLELQPEIVDALPWVVALFPLGLMLGVGFGALESRERFGSATFLQVGGIAMAQVFSVIAAIYVSPSIENAVIAYFSARAIVVVCTYILISFTEGPLRLIHFDPTQVRRLLGYGGWISLSNMATQLLASLDQFLIGSVLGVAAVTPYSIAMNLVVRTQILPVSVSRTIFPRMSSLTIGEAHKVASRAFSAVTFGYGAICATAIVLTPLFFRVWISSDFSIVASPVAIILFLGTWFSGLSFIPQSMLESHGRPHLAGVLLICELPLFALALWYLTYKFGLEGAAITFTFRSAVHACALCGLARMPNADILRAFIPVITMAMSAIMALRYQFDTWLLLACFLVIGAASILSALMFSPDLRMLFLRVAGRV